DDRAVREQRECPGSCDEAPDEARAREPRGDGRVPVLVVDEPDVCDGEQAERDDAAHERPAVRGRGDRDLPEQDMCARDDEREVAPGGEVVRLNEPEVFAPAGLLDRTAALDGERAHDAARMLRIMATMSSRLREIASGGPETTTSTPSPVRREVADRAAGW